LLKEVDILKYLENQEIDFVPQVLDSGDGWFSYEWIEGEHFRDMREYSSPSSSSSKGGHLRSQLALRLLSCAYKLDQLGVIHGELLRPWTNVLVDEDQKVWILDFERGVM